MIKGIEKFFYQNHMRNIWNQLKRIKTFLNYSAFRENFQLYIALRKTIS
ncbi:hypothetical protein pah_c026o136 [Parachlamydia acanthamoebae str. Hall's coccus]|nr:hypothetical protein pah_c026o136 [Parachlamydia acanthamoebae str. Hall's coccus]